ncbi:aldo/keto reductase [Streptomyces sp. NPDC007264]|uniref:aldo/keto reductase n=1 Tax=Streptomyces sp. NPDC007264 TaxID=3364777 RepID=UPI0036D99CFC
MHEPTGADHPGCTALPGHVESDLTDLTGVSLAALRAVPAALRNERLLSETRRARSNAMGSSNPSGGGRVA